MNNIWLLFTECKKVLTNTKLQNKDLNLYKVTNHIDSIILKEHNITKSCYHCGDLEDNDIRTLMVKGKQVFSDIDNYLQLHKPTNVSSEEVSTICLSYGRLCELMD